MNTHEIDVAQASGNIPTPVNPSHTVWLPISSELAKTLAVDEPIHVSFDAIVQEVSSEEGDSYSMSVSLQRVKVETENEFETLSRDEEAD